MAALALLMLSQATAKDDPASPLPTLGSGDTLEVSLADEHRLGQQLIRQFRGIAKLYHDPLVEEYVQNLIHELLPLSEVLDRRVSILLIDADQINAFAAPGGIIGVFSGLLSFARYEGEVVSVLAHELGHLSQRHYARSREKAGSTGLRNILLGIGSALVAIGSGGAAGLAAIAATGAAIHQERLRFSRENEREADQVALRTLNRSTQYDPRYVAETFERMAQELRYSSAPPEYLLTHPLPASRITQARARATKLPAKPRTVNLDYQLIRSRTVVHHANSVEKRLNLFKAWEDQPQPILRFAEAYGRALVLSKSGRHKAARKLMRRLYNKYPDRLYMQYSMAEIELAAERTGAALTIINRSLRRTPNNLPLMWLKAGALRQSGDTLAALRVMEQIVEQQPDSPEIWYQLAETYGLSGDLLSVHKARAEFFYLIGQDQSAIQHLRYAQQLTQDSFSESERIEARLGQIMSQTKKKKGRRKN